MFSLQQTLNEFLPCLGELGIYFFQVASPYGCIKHILLPSSLPLPQGERIMLVIAPISSTSSPDIFHEPSTLASYRRLSTKVHSTSNTCWPRLSNLATLNTGFLEERTSAMSILTSNDPSSFLFFIWSLSTRRGVLRSIGSIHHHTSLYISYSSRSCLYWKYITRLLPYEALRLQFTIMEF